MPVPVSIADELLVPVDDVLISKEELATLIDHMKNSWDEKMTSQGAIFYQNAYDSRVWQWERPRGYIRRREYRSPHPAIYPVIRQEPSGWQNPFRLRRKF